MTKSKDVLWIDYLNKQFIYLIQLGKKFKAKAFRELLLSIQDKPMEDQKVIVDEALTIRMLR
jgi:hypothetical protein